MRKIQKLFIVLFTLVFCFGISTIPAFAASVSQDGLEVTLVTDKTAYDEDEQITATLVVLNTNEQPVSNVSLKHLVPDGYELADGVETTKSLESLRPGETVSIAVDYLSDTDVNTGVAAKEQIDNSSNSDESSNIFGISPDTGSKVSIAIVIILLVAMCGSIIALILVKKKSAKKMLSLFLCITMIGTVTLGTFVPAEAAELQIKTISITESVTVANDNIMINALVKYSLESVENEETTRPTQPENPSEADEYYWNNSEVLAVINAKESTNVVGEAEAITLLQERGFVDYPVTYEYSLDGEYLDEMEASNASMDKHPTYSTYYLSQDKELWSIFIIDGMITANPISFNLNSNLNTQLVLSEQAEVMSYDSATNQFYLTIPKESAIIVKSVDKIDAETLDKLTVEEISKL